MAYTYDEETTDTRWLILGDKEQEFPKEPLEVLEIEERETAAGKKMPVMTLQDGKSGAKYQIVAWKRDVNECISQYGKNPEQWDLVTFAKKNGRMSLVPAGMAVKVLNVA